MALYTTINRRSLLEKLNQAVKYLNYSGYQTVSAGSV